MQNLLTYLKELNIVAVVTKSENITSIRFGVGNVTQTLAKESSHELFCAAPSRKGHHVVVLKSMAMGEGDPELGELLMRSCLNSFVELDSLPNSIILYNDGAKLAIIGTDSSLALQKLEDAGVEILICGACVDYYGLKERINIGTVSNMYKINSVISSSSHVIYP